MPFIKLSDGTIAHVRMGKRGAKLSERDIKAIEEVRGALQRSKEPIGQEIAQREAEETAGDNDPRDQPIDFSTGEVNDDEGR